MKWIHDWLAEFATAAVFAGFGFFISINNRVSRLEDSEKKLDDTCKRVDDLADKVTRHEIMLNTVETLHEELKQCMPQIVSLSNLSTRLEEILKGMDRRLVLVEDELIARRKN